MATLKQRLHKRNASGGYDVLHLETSASAVLMSDGTTAEAAINDKASGKRVSITLPATAGWYRIATSASSISNCMGLFAIRSTVSGAHGNVLLSAGISYGNAGSASVQVLHCSNWTTVGLTQARIVYHTTHSGQYAYLEVYNSQNKALVLTINMALNEGWTLLTTSTAGSVPEGYTSESVTFVNNRIIAGSFGGSAAALTTARTIDGVSFNGSANITHYGVCSTAAATAAKVVSCTGFTLATGARIIVKFTNTNTAANPTLNVNSTGAKAIYYRGTAISADYLISNGTLEFVYNGTQYELVGEKNINTTNTTGTNNKASTKLFLAGATTQASSPTTYSNAGVYIGADNGLYANKKKLTSIPFIVGTQTAATGTWTGTTNEIDALVDGQTIRYWLPYNGSGNATLTLTINGTATSAIPVYVRGTTRCATQYPAGSIITLTYRASYTIAGTSYTTGAWYVDAEYWTGDTKVTQAAAITKNGNYPVLLAYSTATTAVTNTVNKSTKLLFNPSTGKLTATQVAGAIWNDYAEYRETQESFIRPGHCVIENGDGSLRLSSERLQPGGNIVSDTFGFAIGETDQCKTPLAVAGRVLAYPLEDRDTYEPGDAVCTGPNGTVSKMSDEEIMRYPHRIVGTVSEIPQYDIWGTGKVSVDGRIWIKIK